uniref:Uncharacterized protein n=1 Tax=Siphoviridae sp. ctoiW10 TaxID=2827592 RepID=A0A8S5LPX6_9CAUD|nr:MAG TPA: hypothetical protein [Siphoviridae sp. ctoiW10]
MFLIIYNSVIISRFKITNNSVIILCKMYIYRIIYRVVKYRQ